MRYKIFLHGFGIFLFILSIIIYFFVFQRIYQPNYDLSYYSKLPIAEIPLIKAGTKFFDSPLLENMGIKTGLLKDCPKQCNFMDEKMVILKTKVDITLLHARDLKDEKLEEIKYASNMNFLGTKVLYSIESPLYTPVNGFNNDYIITYHSNSYGLLRKYDFFERITATSGATDVWSDAQYNV
uniref:Uncharacterized protein n=1 Tax=Panagrolaimus superbus TaxID=310955 RepID=A0A914Y1U6_9BILA